MIKKIFYFSSISVLVTLSGYFLYSWMEHKNISNYLDASPVQLKFLDQGFFKILPSEQSYLVSLTNFVILEEELKNDPIFSSLKEKQIELYIVSVLRQYAETIAREKIIFFLPKPSRPIDNILNQYGIDFVKKSQILFENSHRDNLAKIGDIIISRKDVQIFDYRWGSYRTQLFEEKARFVKKRIVNKTILKIAEQSDMSVQDFIQDQVTDKNQSIESFLRNNYLQTPIAINLRVPYFDLDLKPDWTPTVGKPGSLITYVVFDSFFSETGKRYFHSILTLYERFPEISFSFRPVFPKKDHLQRLLAHISFCVWDLSKDDYWLFLQSATQTKFQNPEVEYYKITDELGLDSQQVRLCVYEKKFKKIIQYHLDYAKYLNLFTGPLIFLNGLVYDQPLSNKFIEGRLEDFRQSGQNL